jgi:hypothetical protein
MNDLEEEYTEKIENEEEIFIDGLQNKKNIEGLEKEYSKKVKEIRKIYEKSLKKDLYEEKEREIKKIKNRIKTQEKEEKEFHTEGLKLDDGWKEKEEIEIASRGYKLERKIKNFIQKITPNFLLYSYYKLKRSTKDFFRVIGDFFEDNWNKFTENIMNSLSFIKEGFIKIISDLAKIATFFKKKKKEGEKKEDGNKDSEK